MRHTCWGMKRKGFGPNGLVEVRLVSLLGGLKDNSVASTSCELPAAKAAMPCVHTISHWLNISLKWGCLVLLKINNKILWGALYKGFLESYWRIPLPSNTSHDFTYIPWKVLLYYVQMKCISETDSSDHISHMLHVSSLQCHAIIDITHASIWYTLSWVFIARLCTSRSTCSVVGGAHRCGQQNDDPCGPWQMIQITMKPILWRFDRYIVFMSR